jgi:hypothetical protein
MSRFPTLILAAFLAVPGRTIGGETSPADLVEGFLRPPQSGVQAYYYLPEPYLLTGGRLRPENITRQFEEFAAVGLRSLVWMDQGNEFEYLGEEWFSYLEHAVAEARRLGLTLSMVNTYRWDFAGPWVSADLGAQRLVWASAYVQGGTTFDDRLPQPFSQDHIPTQRPHYRDLAVVAVRHRGHVPARRMQAARPVVTGTAPTPHRWHPEPEQDLPGHAVDGNPFTYWSFPEGNRACSLTLSFEQPFSCDAVNIAGACVRYPSSAVLQVSDDGEDFRDHAAIALAPRNNPAVNAIPPVSARHFRLHFARGHGGVNLAEVELLGREEAPQWRTAINNWQYNTANGFWALPTEGTPTQQDYREVADTEFLASRSEPALEDGEVIDLTGRMQSDGRLRWEAPPGNWEVLRFGHTLYVSGGRGYHPHPNAGAAGHVVDIFRREAVEHQFKRVGDRWHERFGADFGSVISALHEDSYEGGWPNWTPSMPDEFERRRGYAMVRYLPILAGKLVRSDEISKRFLHDFRQTLGDLYVENYWGVMTRWAKARGIRTELQPAQGFRQYADYLLAHSQADVPQGEIWGTRDREARGSSAERAPWDDLPTSDITRHAVMAGHLYGKRIISAEAFTRASSDIFSLDLDMHGHKYIADKAFARGINHIAFNGILYNDRPEDRPGLLHKLNPIDRQTWWPQAGALMEYLNRCSHLLQQGIPQADAVYLLTESVPVMVPGESWMSPVMPPGYLYDCSNTDALLNRMQVVDGKIVLPDGVSYRLLILPETERMTPERLGRIREMVEAGLTVVGPRPKASPSLTGFPECDRIIKETADSLWGRIDGREVTENWYGRGRIVWGRSLQAVLDEMRLPPVFSYMGGGAEAKLRFTHRKVGETEVFFVANQSTSKSREDEVFDCRFRVNGKVPELWHPAENRIEPIALYSTEPEGTRMTLRLAPYASVFVVFKPGRAGRQVVGVARDGAAATPFVAAGDRQEPAFAVTREESGRLRFRVWKAGIYEVTDAQGRQERVDLRRVPEPIRLDGLWRLRFPPDQGAPLEVVLNELKSWHLHPDPGVRHFSGTAVYEREVAITPGDLAPGRRFHLDLGEVRSVAAVRVNGRKIGVSWTPPHVVDVTDTLAPGANTVEIEVTNLWINRLKADLDRPREQRLTVARFRTPLRDSVPTDQLAGFLRDLPVQPSGLLEPVLLRVSESVFLPEK